MTTTFPLAIVIGAVDRLTGPLAKMEGRLGKFGAKATKIGKAISLGLTAPILGFGVTAVRSFIKYENGMLRVKALTGATSEEMLKLEERSQQLGLTTAKTATEVASGMAFLAQSGFQVAEIFAETEGVVNLAVAAVLEMGETADIATNIVLGFGKELSFLGEASNILSRAFTGANVDLIQLGEAFKRGGPVASALNQSFADTTAILQALGDAGLQGSIGGTTLLNTLIELANTTPAVQKELMKFGLREGDLKDSTGAMRSLIDIIETLEKKGVAAQDVVTIFGKRAGVGLAVLLNRGSESLRAFRTELEDGVETARIAEIMLSGLGGKFVLLGSAISGASIKIVGTGIIGSLGKLVDKTTEWTLKLSELDPELIKNTLAIVGIVAVAGPLILLLGQATLVMGGLVSVAQFLWPVLLLVGKALFTTVIPAIWAFTVALLANPIGLVVGIVLALIVVLGGLAARMGSVKAVFLKAWEGIKTGFFFIITPIMAQIDLMLAMLEKTKSVFGFGSDSTLTVNGGVSAGPSISPDTVAAVASGGPIVQRTESAVKFDFSDLPAGTRVTTEGDIGDEIELALGFAMGGIS